MRKCILPTSALLLSSRISVTEGFLRAVSSSSPPPPAQQALLSTMSEGDEQKTKKARISSSTEQSTVTQSTAEQGHVTILDKNECYVVASKPPSVVCHHSDYTGSRASGSVPMLQRTREALGGKRINLVHRLDRGCSGCLLMAYAENADDDPSPATTTLLSEAMALPTSQKTYIAIVRGEGIFKGRDFKKEKWFKIDRPIKDEKGRINDATTWFRFIAGQHNAGGTLDRPRASLVLARPETGRWHQIRRHLNGLSAPILGDSTHGDTKLNAEWKRDRGMLAERTCLHMARLQIGSIPDICPNGIDVTDPVPVDMMRMLRDHLPALLEEAGPLLEEEGIVLERTCDESKTKSIVLPYAINRAKGKYTK